MSQLLAKLNKLVGKTPDQIVTNLRSGNWIKGSEMPEDVWTDWSNRRQLVAICHRSDYEPHDIIFDGRDFTSRGWSHREVTTSLNRYWFILASEYVDGEYPVE